ncbi:DUF2924 domain-containing protein [unidentified bacterial endosymbiont]|uniref:DUF2924 domain-containing protein n=1 Tax=unidentified bacterial endosymbiont TaxID=2355 RepID=UPI0020A20E8F|nr:DUF2924 domain-containing protein [unidentified bacterial endosymbiont]
MKIRRSSPSSGASVMAQIVNLPQLGMPELKALWQQLFSSEAPTHNRRFLERRIAYQLQLLEYSKTNQPLVTRNQQRIEQLIALEQQPSPKRAASRALLPGTLLSRHYQGVDHQVVVQDAGRFIYQGRPYSNLSQLAREITGTRWSGPLFFGLKARPKGSTATKQRGGR